MKIVNVPTDYNEDVRLEVDEEQHGLRIRVDGIATPLIHLSDAEELLKALFETLLVPFNAEDSVDREAGRRVEIKRFLRRLGVLEQLQPSILPKQEEPL